MGERWTSDHDSVVGGEGKDPRHSGRESRFPMSQQSPPVAPTDRGRKRPSLLKDLPSRRVSPCGSVQSSFPVVLLRRRRPPYRASHRVVLVVVV